jgi:hypothetical protein
MEKHVLSKSSFIKGMQCQKALYLDKYHKELKDEISTQQEAIFSQGTKVGELARQLFPGGINCVLESQYNFQEAVNRTAIEIAKGTKIIYEAAFQFDEVLVTADILVDDNGWKAYEIKSSTSITETYLLDATLQYYTIVNAGINLKDTSIVYINNQYIKRGAINIEQFFIIESVKETLLEFLPGIPQNIIALKQILAQKEIPRIDIGSHCNTPYSCDFAGYCWKHIPEYSVFNISRLTEVKKFELYKRNVINFVDIPEDYPFNENQRMQVKSELNQQTIIDKKKISKFINDLLYPLYFMDFETISTPVPIFDSSKPYEQLVFQYSLHVLQTNSGELEHKEYLAEVNGLDPRLKFIEQLIADCGDSGDILVYNIGFERGKLNSLAITFPQYSIALNKIISRLKDLMTVFQQRWYYTPAMRGSYSIKKVLPALVPELSYDNLNIAEGGTASATFASMIVGEFEGDLIQTRSDLLAYCKLDTLAMVEILKKLASL